MHIWNIIANGKFWLALFHRCPPEFVYLYREFGGDLSLKDDQGRLATEIAENAPGLKVMKALQGKCIL